VTQAALFEAIRTRFKTEVSDPLELRTIHDNVPEPPGMVAQWCRFSLSIDQNQQVSTGNPGGKRFRMTGNGMVQIFVPIAKGDAAALSIADSIIAAFRNISIAPQITFLGVGVVGTAEQDAAWCRRRVVIPFRADELG
jgi:hypothetical protein